MKKHKAQLYDKIQNVIGNYNDRMVRGVFQYNFDVIQVEKPTLKQEISILKKLLKQKNNL